MAEKVVWFQDDVVHDRFYWLGRAPGTARAGEKIIAEVDGQTIRIDAQGITSLQLFLSDELVDLDLPLIVEVNGTRVHNGVVWRTYDVIWHSLARRFDPRMAATAKLELSW